MLRHGLRPIPDICNVQCRVSPKACMRLHALLREEPEVRIREDDPPGRGDEPKEGPLARASDMVKAEDADL